VVSGASSIASKVWLQHATRLTTSLGGSVGGFRLVRVQKQPAIDDETRRFSAH